MFYSNSQFEYKEDYYNYPPIINIIQIIVKITQKKIEILKENSVRETKDFQEQLSDSMQMNIKYFLPLFIGFIAWKISAAIAIYLIVSNIFTIVQEWHIRKQMDKVII